MVVKWVGGGARVGAAAGDAAAPDRTNSGGGAKAAHTHTLRVRGGG